MSAFCHSNWCFKSQRGMRTSQSSLHDIDAFSNFAIELFWTSQYFCRLVNPNREGSQNRCLLVLAVYKPKLGSFSLASALSVVVDLIYSRQLDPKWPFPGHKIWSVTLLYTLLG